MLADERMAAYRTMEMIGQLEGIEQVRMLNKEGRVTFSTDQAEVGRLVDKRAEACYACHAAGQPLVRLNVPSRSRIFTRDGHRVVGMITPIYNEPSCSTAACHFHPPDKQVLGVVDIAMSLEDEDRAVAELGRTTTLLVGARDPGPRGDRRLVRARLRHPAGRRDPGGHRAGRARRPRPPGSHAADRRNRPAGGLVQRHDGLAAAGTRRTAAAEREPRAPGGGADAGAEERAGAARPVGEDVVARQAGRLGRPRDQQPAGRHPDLREAADPDARGRRAVGEGARELHAEPAPRAARDRAVQRDRPQPARLRAAASAEPEGAGRERGGRGGAVAAVAPPRHAERRRWRRTCRRCRRSRPTSASCGSRS